MVRLEGVVESERGVDEVWPLMADFTNVAAWDPTVTGAVALDGGPAREGQRFRVDVRMGPTTTSMTYRLLVFDPPRRLVAEGVGGVVRALDDVRVEPTADGCRVVWRADLSLRGPLALTERLWRPALARFADVAIGGLRDWLPGARSMRTRLEPRGTKGPATVRG